MLDGQRRIHLHLRQVGRPNERFAILLRDDLRAQHNSFEALTMFIAGVRIAEFHSGPQARIDRFAVLVIAVRLGRIAAYVADLATIRTLLRTVGIGLSIAMLVVACDGALPLNLAGPTWLIAAAQLDALAAVAHLACITLGALAYRLFRDAPADGPDVPRVAERQSADPNVDASAVASIPQLREPGLVLDRLADNSHLIVSQGIRQRPPDRTSRTGGTVDPTD